MLQWRLKMMMSKLGGNKGAEASLNSSSKLFMWGHPAQRWCDHPAQRWCDQCASPERFFRALDVNQFKATPTPNKGG